MKDSKQFDPLLKQLYGESLKELKKGGKRYFSKLRTKIKKSKKQEKEATDKIISK